MNAAVTTSAVDLDTSNNSAPWETDVHCSINGTAGDDILHGTKNRDSICGGKGDDRIKVGAYDRTFGGHGRDIFHGVDLYGFESDGDSWAIGGPGLDTVTFARASHSIIFCRFGGYGTEDSSWGPDAMMEIERVIGSRYDDQLAGSSGRDTLVGGPGNDRILGGRETDKLIGGSGSDEILARDHERDAIFGGPGRDRTGADALDYVKSASRVSGLNTFNPCGG